MSKILLHMLPLVLLISFYFLFVLLRVLIGSVVDVEVHAMLYLHS
jgi:hypothetical protein